MSEEAAVGEDPVWERITLGRMLPCTAESTPQGWLRLNANEFPFPPSPRVAPAVAQAVGTVNRYPDPFGEPLRSRLADHHGVAVDQILVSHGADGILAACFRAFVDPGAPVVLLDPTYPFLNNLAGIAAAEVVLAASPKALFASAKSLGNGMAVLVNPNNPTGKWLPPQQVLAGAPETGVFVVDEAYAPFAPSSTLDSLRHRHNCVVVRSFSKSYGLAGVRVGYAVGSAGIIERLAAVQDPYPVSSLAVAAASAALEDEPYYSECIASLCSERTRLTQGLRALGWVVDESHANFVFAEPPQGTASEYLAILRGERIHIRTFERASRALRISVGLPDQNDAALRAIRSHSSPHRSD